MTLFFLWIAFSKLKSTQLAIAAGGKRAAGIFQAVQ
jgi:hypothetical protein